MIDYSHYADDFLLKQLCLGDESAFSEIYRRYKFILYQHAWNKTRNKEEAEDVLQEVFTNLWQEKEKINISTNLSGYLYTAVRNRVLDRLAHAEVKLRYISNFKIDEPVPTDHLVRENQLKAMIEREIETLPPRVRQAFELSRKQHLTHKEIAQELGTSEETVKKQISVALKTLRLKFGILAYLFFLLNR